LGALDLVFFVVVMVSIMVVSFRYHLMTFTHKKTDRLANKRPDLLLNENLNGECLLLEFKRPSHPLNRDDYVQATNYRHDLAKLMSKPIKVLVVGGKRSPDFPISNLEPEVAATTFSDVIATARRQLNWQLTEQI
jgi:hypothetical protein